jgi:hypothetical protein
MKDNLMPVRFLFLRSYPFSKAGLLTLILSDSDKEISGLSKSHRKTPHVEDSRH